MPPSFAVQYAAEPGESHRACGAPAPSHGWAAPAPAGGAVPAGAGEGAGAPQARATAGRRRRPQCSRAPGATSPSGTASRIAPVSSVKPSTRTSERIGPIWRGGKFTTAITSRPTRSSGR